MLSSLVTRAGDLTTEAAGLGSDRLLPVSDQFKTLLPGYGLRRGSVTGVTGTVPGTTSLLLALMAAASAAGSWCAVVGMPALGFVAAAETGIVLERLALVPNPGPDWPNVVAALIDGFDVVVIGAHHIGGQIAASVCAQMAARARRRGSVLVPFGSGWDGAEVTFSLVDSGWDGVGEGAGRKVTIAARGRGAAARGQLASMWLPASTNAGHFAPLGSDTASAARLRMVR
ncbi:MAG TPA: hypothetical protein VGF84_12010 [Micromonosporaceae bacterium]